ncbi:hypothetical protein RM844_22745 [Streptomyces sp. DSM 44915]|uniref:Uncharacterized protein n=1 Tax=Streptomyces chisholmiae TaxID=3075540 RepID=A0ABU2JWJ8_9ACTN|nr:hypothetical protein [Streptomyces sp. DSM 44915]MDT0269109.1 hypothetical protein [Streptomyces sp. DSM 44915]
MLAAPHGFLDDFPRDIRRAAPPPTARQRRAGTVRATCFPLTFLVVMAAVRASWVAGRQDAGWPDAAAIGLVAVALSTALDTFVIDRPVVSRWRRPGWSSPAPRRALAGTTGPATCGCCSCRAPA